MSGVGQVVTLGIGEELFAIPVSRVQEILDWRRIARLPNAPPHVLGVIDVRGTGVSVLDLRYMLRLEPVDADDGTRILVIWVQQGDRQARIALRADRVYEVTALENDTVEPVPEADLLRWDHRLVSGIGRHGEAFVTLLDLDHMLESLPLPQSASSAA